KPLLPRGPVLAGNFHALTWSKNRRVDPICIHFGSPCWKRCRLDARMQGVSNFFSTLARAGVSRYTPDRFKSCQPETLMTEVTRILSGIQQGDPHAAEQLLPLVYHELRRLAAEKMAQEKRGQTLQATALVHEAYLRLVDVEKVQHWNSRGHFFAAAAE